MITSCNKTKDVNLMILLCSGWISG